MMKNVLGPAALLFSAALAGSSTVVAADYDVYAGAGGALVSSPTQSNSTGTGVDLGFSAVYPGVNAEGTDLGVRANASVVSTQPGMQTYKLQGGIAARGYTPAGSEFRWTGGPPLMLQFERNDAVGMKWGNIGAMLDLIQRTEPRALDRLTIHHTGGYEIGEATVGNSERFLAVGKYGLGVDGCMEVRADRHGSVCVEADGLGRLGTHARLDLGGSVSYRQDIGNRDRKVAGRTVKTDQPHVFAKMRGEGMIVKPLTGPYEPAHSGSTFMFTVGVATDSTLSGQMR